VKGTREAFSPFPHILNETVTNMQNVPLPRKPEKDYTIYKDFSNRGLQPFCAFFTWNNPSPTERDAAPHHPCYVLANSQNSERAVVHSYNESLLLFSIFLVRLSSPLHPQA